MLGILKRLFGRRKTAEFMLAKEGVTEKQLTRFGKVSFDINVNNSNRECIQQLSNIEGLEISQGPSQLLGGETLSCISSVITIIQALIIIEKWLGDRISVTISSNGEKIRLKVNDAIMYLIKKVKQS